ncbi:acyltransferase family protein [Mucilaginibacter sp. UYCu711]|uniref:acyltransferase family protein n=1 Tax=Mucilaginibacter sp. UYCu711 TaxID=3156339 RepID=UPI003D215529
MQEKKRNYEFIDAIRCITMMFIVCEHCIAAGGYRYRYDSNLYWTFLASMQVAKFATITFFLLAGFLLGENFSTYSPFEYLWRRLQNTVGPWVFWSLLFVVFDIIRVFLIPPIGHSGAFTLHNILINIKGLYTYSAYWFIINFMISISLLLLFRKYLYSLYFGAILGLCTIFYSVNIYYLWIFPNHTTAILGFVFFLWLGVQLRKHWGKIKKIREMIPFYVLLGLLIGTYAIAIYESTILEDVGGDPTNTLRFSNILYSLIVFALLLKINTFNFTRSLKPKETTYGIYLIHFILVVFLLPNIFTKIEVTHLSVLQFLGYRLTWFFITYTLTFFIVTGLNKTRAKALIGN